jgi:type I restriction-modification system DNA methylase subunit
MALFQKSVLNQFLKQLDKNEVAKAYTIFKSHFHNATIQQQIRESKEEQYQEGFFRDLFVEVLGFTLNPQPNYNLITEQKNEVNSKKADGAILKDGNVIAVIELKGTNTTDLNTVTSQAFGYKNNQKNCKYVLISNFEKLRVYIDNAIDFEEFDLFTLTAERFEILYLCLKANNILTDLPDKIKQASTVKEENVTKQLYKDYSDFKRKLFTDTVQLNPQYDKLILFKKSQKLLDRILFILFAEDRGLLQANTIQTILDEFENLKKLDAYSPLYDRFKKHFTYLNEGFKNEKYEVFGYNGGLFAPDEVLDNILISDNLLLNYTPTLGKYDYDTEIDVNILGHIFEHSLNDIEEIQAELEGKEIEKTKTKRKKDGVFYTPKYITKYIVENTVGALCIEKRNEYGIIADNYTPDKRKAKKKELLNALDTYQNWLLEITIVDPACGSGAFLNQALDFLIQEHRSIDELRAQLLGHSFVLSDHEISILENNIFGVDLNEESVEIARLSLWLRTARKGRKLNSLNNNIKCGNSLIDDKAIAGEKAFNWKNEFPKIFELGGFDVVIGNPPYVFGGNEGISDKEKDFFKSNYETGNGKINLFTLFIEKSYRILRDKGAFSFIIPNTFLRVTSYHESRKFFIDKFSFKELADLGTDIFEGAVTTAMILVAFKELPNKDSKIRIIKDFSGAYNELTLKDVLVNNYIITSNVSNDKSEILKKINNNSIALGDECKEMIFGVVITKNKEEVVSEIQLQDYKPFLEGKDISSYIIKPIHQYLNYKPELLHRARTKAVFEVPEKLLVQRITGGKKPLKVAYDNNGLYNKESINNIILNDDSKLKAKFILTLLNSSLINWCYNNQFTNESLLTVNISKEYLSRIPIKVPTDQQPFIEKAETMLLKKKELQTIKSNVIKLLQSQYSGININTKLSNWNELSFKDFCKELEKQKIKLTISEKAELMQYFETEQTKANSIQQIITQTDKEIDTMVYKLYELTEEEINIIENN